MKKHLVIGMGEIGKPLYNILKEYYDVSAFDQLGNYFTQDKFDVIHICFGHKEHEIEDFKQWVNDYKNRFLKENGLVIIHSTVAVGICQDLRAVHSPIRGMHYNMEESIMTFVKFFGGNRADEAAEYFRRIGIKVMVLDKSETTEAMKLFDTQYYLECVKFCQRVKQYCDKYHLNFHEVYTLANQTYNEGYIRLQHSEFFRPVLQPIMQEIGGHCLTQNEKLLKLSE